MRVLQVTHRYWPFRGGSENYFGQLSRDLVRAGHEVTVLTTNAEDLDHLWGTGYRHLTERCAILDGARVCRFPVRHPLGRAYGQLTIKRLNRDVQQAPVIGHAISRRLSRWAPALPELYRHLARRNDPDTLVHAGNILFDGLIEAALESARRRSLPFAVTPFPHLGDARSALWRDYASPRQIALLRRADLVIAQTCFEADWLADRGVSRARIAIVPAGPDLDELAGGDAERAHRRWDLPDPYVLYLGPTAPDKGFLDLVDAVESLAAGPSPVGLVAAGPITEPGRDRLSRLPAHRHRQIRCLGMISDPEERNDLLAACRLVALPSRTDSLGQAILEGWAYRKPVVVARAGALAEVVSDGEDGLLVPFGDPARLAGAIGRLTTDRNLAKRLGQAGREKLVRRYQWRQSSQRLLGIFAELEVDR